MQDGEIKQTFGLKNRLFARLFASALVRLLSRTSHPATTDGFMMMKILIILIYLVNIMVQWTQYSDEKNY